MVVVCRGYERIIYGKEVRMKDSNGNAVKELSVNSGCRGVGSRSRFQFEGRN